MLRVRRVVLAALLGLAGIGAVAGGSAVSHSGISTYHAHQMAGEVDPPPPK